MPVYADVLVPVPLKNAIYEYRWDGPTPLAVGSFVQVPFGKQQIWGVVMGVHAQAHMSEAQLKMIQAVSDAYALDETELAFLTRMAAYTQGSLGAVLKMVLPVPDVFVPEKKPLPPVPLPQSRPATFTFTTHQQDAMTHLREAYAQPNPRPILLDGVTGSGKTEVYFELIHCALADGKQSLVLLPEISLTSQWLDRFEGRFGCRPLVWNSTMTPAQRRKAWRQIVSGDAKVILGARSALMLPYHNLGCIIVDEEHDTSYKQEEGVLYHARDMAVLKAHLQHIPIVLVSATPSLESYYNAQQGKYQHVVLLKRAGRAVLPPVTLIDLKKEPAQPQGARWISQPLQAEIRKNLEVGEQSLLFLNRRGYAPLVLCRGCGHRFRCQYCSTWLVAHQSTQRLTCHHCGHSMPWERACPECHEEGTLVSCGPGVERIAEEAQQLFPDARILVISSDLSHSAPQLAERIHQIEAHAVDIIIGTQIMAKGHTFPLLTLVGVIDADLGLAGGDLRACEKTYQLLHQVGGRCGRVDRPGRVLLQTFYADHPVMQALQNHDRDTFLQQELTMRQEAGMPPFGRLASIIVSGHQLDLVESFVRQLRRQAPTHSEICVLGPAQAPLQKLRGRHRWRFLIQGPRTLTLQPFLQRWLNPIKVPRLLKIQVDIDPVSFL